MCGGSEDEGGKGGGEAGVLMVGWGREGGVGVDRVGGGGAGWGWGWGGGEVNLEITTTARRLCISTRHSLS